MRARDLPRLRAEKHRALRPYVESAGMALLSQDEQKTWRMAWYTLGHPDVPMLFISSDMCRLIQEAVGDMPPEQDNANGLPNLRAIFPEEAGVKRIFIGFGETLVTDDGLGTPAASDSAMVIGIEDGRDWGLFFVPSPDLGMFTGGPAQRWLLALDNLLGSPGIAETVRREPRNAGKKSSRKSARKPGEVRVIDLRKKTKAAVKQVGEARKMGMHRWIVRGHWRNQACGPGRQERRMTYIAPYVKGPDGAPLLEGAKVYRW